MLRRFRVREIRSTRLKGSFNLVGVEGGVQVAFQECNEAEEQRVHLETDTIITCSSPSGRIVTESEQEAPMVSEQPVKTMRNQGNRASFAKG